MARLIADAAIAASSDALLPLTKSGTARQKLQRAAAQEFLCPIEGMKQRMSLPYPDPEELAQVADDYQVSELMVTNSLVNKKLLGRDYLQ